MDVPGQLERGRESFTQLAWRDAFAALSAADNEDALEPEDLLRLAMAAYLIGRHDDSIEILSRAHREALARGELELAVRGAFWLFFELITQGDEAQAGGWFARGRRILDENQLDCVEQGYLLVPVALQNLHGRNFPTALDVFSQAIEIARRFHDVDLMTLGRLGRGRALIGLGRTAEGVSLLDEVMLSVTTGEASAIVAGLVYCAVISACQEAFDARRAREWTEALSRWCASQPDLVPYRGQCLVHRAQIMQLRGSWSEALEEAERARDQLDGAPDQFAIGMAYYELAEVHRLRGDFDEAEEGYRQASQMGHTPQPGLARLRLAQGQVASAAATTRRVLDEALDLVGRSKVLSAHVEIMLAAEDVPAARIAADELSKIASAFDAPLLHAVASRVRGAVLLAEGEARSALAELRDASTAWQELEVPYETASVRVLVGLACRALGDEDAAVMEFDSARWAFEKLGAEPDIARVETLAGKAAPQTTDGLTGREIEVLALVATGKTNREIAAELVISEKTVARHVSNIFIKVGVTSRAAATAYAYQHDLT